MKNGICLKCGATTVHEVDTYKYADAGIPIGTWGAIGVKYYMCVTCGYIEAYVSRSEDLAKIAEKKPRVIPEG
jgi:hypothetical protein